MFSATKIDLLEQTKLMTEFFSNTTNQIMGKTNEILEENAQQANLLYMMMTGSLFAMLLLLVAVTVLSFIIYRRLGSPTEVICFQTRAVVLG